MAVPSSITDLSTTASSNSPSGSENPKEGDNHLRAAYSFIRTLYNWLTDGTQTIAVATATAGGLELGYRSIPPMTATSGTAAIGARGRMYHLDGSLTIPANVFSAGDVFSVLNDTSGSLTITQGSGMTLLLGGTTSSGDRTLARTGIATIYIRNAVTAIISGAGLS